MPAKGRVMTVSPVQIAPVIVSTGITHRINRILANCPSCHNFANNRQAPLIIPRSLHVNIISPSISTLIADQIRTLENTDIQSTFRPRDFSEKKEKKNRSRNCYKFQSSTSQMIFWENELSLFTCIYRRIDLFRW